jgi:carbon-monoxide dehydrogenase small subunit
MAKWACILNGQSVEADVIPNATLAEALRESANALEVKVACGEGTCAACTVEVNGELIRSCLYPAFRAKGTNITTAAQYADGPIAQAIAEHGGLQCGFCTPGMVVTTHSLVHKEGVASTPESMRKALGGNLCRCTGYMQLLEGAAAGLKKAREQS